MKKWRNSLASIKQRLSVFLENIRISQKAQAHVGKKVLWLLSLFWKIGAELRHWAYDRKIFSSHSLKIPVISIGNISMGGTGKTPSVLFLSEELQKKKLTPSILSRGYTSMLESKKTATLCTGQGPLFSWREMGDEPFLLASRLPRLPIWVGKNRVHGGISAQEKGARLCILDDGLQYRKLQRDFEVITLQGEDLEKELHFFPRGNLRDSVKRLQKADLILLQNISDESQFASSVKKLRNYTQSPAVGMCYAVDAVLDRNFLPKDSLEKIPVGIFCGIARPSLFRQTVESLGVQIVEEMRGADHASFSDTQLREFALCAERKGAKYLLCTEKDWVKLSKKNQDNYPILFVKMQLKIISGYDEWKIFIEKISNIVNTKAISMKRIL